MRLTKASETDMDFELVSEWFTFIGNPAGDTVERKDNSGINIPKGAIQKNSYNLSDNYTSFFNITKTENDRDNMVVEGQHVPVVYGPYIWLPKGRIKVSVKYTDYGWNHLSFIDISTNGASQKSDFIMFGSLESKKYNDYYIGGNLEVQYFNYLLRNDTDRTVEYEFVSDGVSADWEFRSTFNDIYNSVSKVSDYVETVTITRVDETVVSYDCNGGVMSDGTVNGILTDNIWGSKRTSKVEIPKKAGYSFCGWTTYAGIKSIPNKDESDGYNHFFTDEKGNIVGEEAKNSVVIWNENGMCNNDSYLESSWVNYTVYAVWKPNTYTVTYDANGGVATKEPFETSWSNTAVYDTFYTTIANCYKDGTDWLERTGYTFVGWSTEKNATSGSSWACCDSELSGKDSYYHYNGVYYWKGIWNGSWGLKDVVLYAVWKPKTDTVYKVNHYLMNLDETTYKLEDTDCYEGQTDSRVFPDTKSYKGFLSPPVREITIKGDGTTELDYYYERKKYNVTYNVSSNGGKWSDGSTDSKVVKVLYEDDILLRGDAGKDDYVFCGWSRERNGRNSLSSLKMDDEDILLYGLFYRDVNVRFVFPEFSQYVSGRLWNCDSYVKLHSPDFGEQRYYKEWKNVTEIEPLGFTDVEDVCLDGGTDVQLNEDSYFMANKNLVFYALYKAKAQISFDPQLENSSGKINDMEAVVYKNTSSNNSVSAEIIRLPVCKDVELDSKKGYITTYEFRGWNIEKTDYSVGEFFKLDKNVKALGLWKKTVKPISYTVKFDTDFGKPDVEDMRLKYGEISTIPDYVEKVGFLVATWEGSNGRKFNSGDKFSNLTVENNAIITIKAVWEQRRFKTVKIANSMYRNYIINNSVDMETIREPGKVYIRNLAMLSGDKCIRFWRVIRSI